MKKTFSMLLTFSLCLLILAGCGSNANNSTASKTESSTPSSSEAVSSEGSAVESSVASADGDSQFATTLADIKEKGELVIGLDDTFAPMGFRDADGTLVGFDIDLATAVCEKLGVIAKFQPIEWSAKEMELASGKIDCIWNGMSITPEREEGMSLSGAYLNNKIIVMTKEGVTVKDKADLANYNVGIQAGSSALETVQADDVWADIESNVSEYPTYDEVIMDINAGRLDCMIIDEVFGNYKNANLGGTLGTAGFDFGDDLYAVGFRKGDADLTAAVNEALASLAEDGTSAEISEKWFGKNIVIS